MVKGCVPRFQVETIKRALVIRVDQADQVAEHDAVLMAQARSRQQHGG